MTPQQHFNKLRQNLRKNSLEFMNRVLTLIRNEVVLNLTGRVLRRRTGRLVSSITTRVRKQATVVQGIIGTNVWYGRMWELSGYPAHVVVPIRARALKIPIGKRTTGRGGRTLKQPKTIFIFRKRAFIPAQKARPFIAPAIAKSHPAIYALHGIYMVRSFPKEPIVVDIKV